MRKLRLDIQELEVESFSVSGPRAGGGTVRGRMVNEGTNVTCIDCGGTWTCVGPTLCCPATWQQTCNLSCYFTECGFFCATLAIGNTCAASCASCAGQNTCDNVNTCLEFC
jgi:hypothetical protein